jgi:hypothetical protein
MWNFEASVDYAAIRGAVAMSRAGGQPIARFAHAEESGGRSTGFYVGMGCLILTMLCAGCGGLAGILKWLGVY